MRAAPRSSACRSGPPRNDGNPKPKMAPMSPSRGVRTIPSPTPRDGDIGAIFGFGFPSFRGGPLRHADDLGAARIVSELERLAERYGARFAPSDVLRDQAHHNAKFYPDRMSVV